MHSLIFSQSFNGNFTLSIVGKLIIHHLYPTITCVFYRDKLFKEGFCCVQFKRIIAFFYLFLKTFQPCGELYEKFFITDLFCFPLLCRNYFLRPHAINDDIFFVSENRSFFFGHFFNQIAVNQMINKFYALLRILFGSILFFFSL